MALYYNNFYFFFKYCYILSRLERLGQKEELVVDLLSLNVYKLFLKRPDFTMYTCFM